MRKLPVAALLFVALAACSSPPPQESTTPLSPTQQSGDEKDWSFLIKPYAPLINIDGDASLGRATGGDVDVQTDDIVDNLELGGGIHGEAYHASGWGVIVDYAFLDISDDISGPLGLVSDADLFQGILEAFASYRFETEPAIVDVYGGIRWWENEIDVGLTVGPGQISRDFDWVDQVIGAKARFPINDRWDWLLRGDVGVFGEEADSTWSASSGFLYRFSDWFAADLQYRWLGVDYEEGRRGTPSFYEYDTITHGLLIGFSFEF